MPPINNANIIQFFVLRSPALALAMPASRLPISAAHDETRCPPFAPHRLFGQHLLLAGERRQLAGHCAPAFRSVACELPRFRCFRCFRTAACKLAQSRLPYPYKFSLIIRFLGVSCSSPFRGEAVAPWHSVSVSGKTLILSF